MKAPYFYQDIWGAQQFFSASSKSKYKCFFESQQNFSLFRDSTSSSAQKLVQLIWKINQKHYFICNYIFHIIFLTFCKEKKSTSMTSLSVIAS